MATRGIRSLEVFLWSNWLCPKQSFWASPQSSGSVSGWETICHLFWILALTLPLCPCSNRWLWQTGGRLRGLVKTPTPSSMAGRPTWTWPTWGPSLGVCRQVRSTPVSTPLCFFSLVVLSRYIVCVFLFFCLKQVRPLSSASTTERHCLCLCLAVCPLYIVPMVLLCKMQMLCVWQPAFSLLQASPSECSPFTLHSSRGSMGKLMGVGFASLLVFPCNGLFGCLTRLQSSIKFGWSGLYALSPRLQCRCLLS